MPGTPVLREEEAVTADLSEVSGVVEVGVVGVVGVEVVGTAAVVAVQQYVITSGIRGIAGLVTVAASLTTWRGHLCFPRGRHRNVPGVEVEVGPGVEAESAAGGVEVAIVVVGAVGRTGTEGVAAANGERVVGGLSGVAAEGDAEVPEKGVEVEGAEKAVAVGVGVEDEEVVTAEEGGASVVGEVGEEGAEEGNKYMLDGSVLVSFLGVAFLFFRIRGLTRTAFGVRIIAFSCISRLRPSRGVRSAPPWCAGNRSSI